MDDQTRSLQLEQRLAQLVLAVQNECRLFAEPKDTFPMSINVRQAVADAQEALTVEAAAA